MCLLAGYDHLMFYFREFYSGRPITRLDPMTPLYFRSNQSSVPIEAAQKLIAKAVPTLPPI